ncbi:splicing regulator RBM11 isoform X2 [Canis lupus dingo]|uniref:splicing regulator RBM11 isoform X2 n=1 Tax=Canis lupus dingo TaxID=286419 RepID=UPI000DC74605|nr:splicing regulator RBM11 isoform X2 [Canis lupus dingo]
MRPVPVRTVEPGGGGTPSWPPQPPALSQGFAEAPWALGVSGKTGNSSVPALQAGPLTKVTICKDREGKPKTFGFVCFKHPESVSYAIALLNGIRLYGRPINVQYRFGSSRSSEPANQSFENCIKINSHSYRNEEVVGRASFPMQFFPINTAALPQGYFFFQKMWPAYNPALQLPYYEMAASLPNSTAASSSLNCVPDLEAGPSSYERTHQQPSDPDLYQTNKRKRQKQTSDSDSSTENKRGNEYSQKFRKCKKKKRF